MKNKNVQFWLISAVCSVLLLMFLPEDLCYVVRINQPCFDKKGVLTLPGIIFAIQMGLVLGVVVWSILQILGKRTSRKTLRKRLLYSFGAGVITYLGFMAGLHFYLGQNAYEANIASAFMGVTIGFSLFMLHADSQK